MRWVILILAGLLAGGNATDWAARELKQRAANQLCRDYHFDWAHVQRRGGGVECEVWAPLDDGIMQIMTVDLRNARWFELEAYNTQERRCRLPEKSEVNWEVMHQH